MCRQKEELLKKVGKTKTHPMSLSVDMNRDTKIGRQRERQK